MTMMLNKGATLIEDYDYDDNDDSVEEDFMVVDGVKARVSSLMKVYLERVRFFCMAALLFIQTKVFLLTSALSKLLFTHKQNTGCADDHFLVVDGVAARVSSWMKTFLKHAKHFCMAALLYVKKSTLLLAPLISKSTHANGQHLILMLSFISVLCFVLMSRSTQHQVPFDASRDLSTFVNFEKANLMKRGVTSDDIENVSTDVFKMYARANCVQGEDSENVRLALYTGLDGIPDSVRHKLVAMAVAEGISQKYSIQDTITDFQEEGRAFSYKAFWSTVYLPNGGYETCLLATGVDLTMAETIVSWNEIPQKVQVAQEPCHCGFIYCASSCPVFHEFTAKVPIYERRSMPLKKQKELRNWMIEKSIEAAEPLVVTSEVEWNSVSSFSWTGPSQDYYTGSTDYKTT